MEQLQKTALHHFHTTSGARMAPFAGYDMPIQYKEGIIKEHEWTRTHASLFDVSHMGQFILEGQQSAELLSSLTPSSFIKTKHGRCRYTVLTNEQGGVIDDLIVTRLGDEKFFLVFNASRKDTDADWFNKHIKNGKNLSEIKDQSLIALQGPSSCQVLASLAPETNPEELGYMTCHDISLHGVSCRVTRSGYTGEDGFEISLPNAHVATLWQKMLEHPQCQPAGLGARDSLRLEAGYPLYGHDMDETTSPVEADISWIMNKNHTDFTGAPRILQEKENGPARKRIGIELTEKGIMRENMPLLSDKGDPIGTLTSGGFSPSLKKSIGQGYVKIEYAAYGTDIFVEIRNKHVKAVTCSPAFIAPKTKSTASQPQKKAG